MIFDRIENAAAYRMLSEEIAKAIDYLKKTDFSKMADGRHDLDGDSVYVMVMRYVPKPSNQAKWEAHEKYIDVQYVASGRERIGYAPLESSTAVEKAYDAEKDYALYNVEGDLLTVDAGEFAIFFPQDIHAPGIAPDDAEPAKEVCKVVVKCRIG